MPRATARKPPLHVAFGASAAGSLKMALRELERTDRVVHLNDELNMGPIDGEGFCSLIAAGRLEQRGELVDDRSDDVRRPR